MSQGVNRKAVDNFMSSVDTDLPVNLHLLNLTYDGKKFKWNKETIEAIRHGIEEAYGLDEFRSRLINVIKKDKQNGMV
jgi:hypothetical protein